MSEAKKGQQRQEGSGIPSHQISVFDKKKKKMRLLFMILSVKQLGL